MSYNGYSNYETWNVNLWIDDDEGLQDFWIEQAKNADDIYDLSQQMKEYFQEEMPEVSGTYADLLQAALDSVDWYEIAELFWNEYHETEEEAETE